jgi:Uma2 family endonuclease
MNMVLEKDMILQELLSKDESLLVVKGELKDFYALEECKADFIQGQIYVQMSASRNHEKIFMRLSNLLYTWVQERGLGEVYGSRTPIALQADYHPEPDILFIAADNVGLFGNTTFEGVPELVVEIVSASTRKLDLETKRPLYQQSGIAEIWFIDFLENRIMIDYKINQQYHTVELTAGQTWESKVLAGFVIEAEKIL